MRPYVIWSPPWDHKVGGIRALYALRDGLLDRGLDARLSGEPFNPESIAVYPEIVQDNPFRVERIVRWRLNKAQVPNDGLVFDWMPSGDGAPLLTFDISDHDLLARREGPRSGTALVVRKGTVKPSLVPPGAIEITRDWPAERQATIDILATVDHLVSFDEFTQLNEEACLLGTPVVIYPSGRWSRAEIEAIGVMPGTCWDVADLEYAQEATRDAWPWHLERIATYPALLDRFIEETQARWSTSG